MTCTSTLQNLFYVCGIVDKGILLLFGVFLAVEVRDIDKNFNESKVLGVTIYNCAITSLVILPVLLALDNGVDPTTQQTLTIIAINYIIIFTLIALAFPKFKVIFREKYSNVAAPMATVSKFPTFNTASPDSTLKVDNIQNLGKDDPFSSNRLKQDIDRHLDKIAKLPNADRTPSYVQATFVLQNVLSHLNALREDIPDDSYKADGYRTTRSGAGNNTGGFQQPSPPNSIPTTELSAIATDA